MNFKDYTASILNFLQEGALFHDTTPLMAGGKAFKEAYDKVIGFAGSVEVDVIVGPEPHGFILGCPVAYGLGIGFVPVHKPGGLPREAVSASYDLEYGGNGLCVHRNGIRKGQRVLIVGDLLTTDDVVDATIQIMQELGREIVGCVFLTKSAGLRGQEHLKDFNVSSLVSYE